MSKHDWFVPNDEALKAALTRFDETKLISIDGVWVNPSVRKRNLKYYIFDWDDNILRMPTRIHMDRWDETSQQWVPHVCSTSTFSVIRSDKHYRYPEGNRERAFIEFQDDPTPHGGGSFLADLDAALDDIESGKVEKALSFDVFRKMLVEARLFAIVTARGHRVETLKAAVRRFVQRVLTPVEREMMMINFRGYEYCFDGARTFPSHAELFTRYLNLNHYHAINSTDFGARLAEAAPNLQRQEDRKRFAIHDFIEYLVDILNRSGMNALQHPFSIGFSDDDPHNVAAVRDYIQNDLIRRFPAIKFCVYDTSDPETGTHKMTFSRQHPQQL
ncbi:MAG: hypothetical protein Q4F99_02335 [bacterium]|nr:hypothetical protein [bacterium]